MATLLPTRRYTFPYSMKPYKVNIERKMVGSQAFLSRAIVPTIYLLRTKENYGPTSQYIHKSLNKSMFDTYQQVDHLLGPRTAHCTEPWCQSTVVIHVEK